MKTKQTTAFLLAISLIPVSVGLWADDSMNTMKNDAAHPVTAVHEHEANSAATNTQEYKQQRDEAKASLDQAKKDYEKSLKTQGADSEVTKAAHKRLADAHKDYQKYARKMDKAAQDLTEDEQKVRQDKATQ